MPLIDLMRRVYIEIGLTRNNYFFFFLFQDGFRNGFGICFSAFFRRERRYRPEPRNKIIVTPNITIVYSCMGESPKLEWKLIHLLIKVNDHYLFPAFAFSFKPVNIPLHGAAFFRDSVHLPLNEVNPANHF